MKEVTAFRMDEKDKKLAASLQRLGYKYPTAKIIVCLLAKGKATPREIEYSMSMRQPEVSLGMLSLRKSGLVSKVEIPTPGRGRPTHQYTLNMPIDKFLSKVEAEAKVRIDQIEEDLGALKNLINDLSKSG